MSDFRTAYTPLDSNDEEEEIDFPPQTGAIDDDIPVNIVTVDGTPKARWNHIENLDDFFSRVYTYHQRNGFTCMLLEDVLQLLQFLFIVLFTGILVDCVEYDVLFDSRNATAHGDHGKYTMNDIFTPTCSYGFSRPASAICMSVAFAFLAVRAARVLYNFFKYYEIRTFFLVALKIPAAELQNTTWYDLQQRLMKAQQEHNICIHKQELTELDIYNRILRFRNYFVAMINKSVIPLKFEVPFLGTCTYLSLGLKFNLEYMMFSSPWSPFENSYHLRGEYKNKQKLRELAENLSSKLLWLGIVNLLLSPLILLWQILYCFFVYGEVLKREPSALGARSWSLYAREYLRHYNELSHELNGRLNKAYKVSTAYVGGFVSPLLSILAKNVTFFAGAVFAVLISLSVYDKDVLEVEHVLTLMTGLGLLLTVSRAFIPDEHAVFCPELLMTHIIGHIHYVPDTWKGNAHTAFVRDEFGQLFPFKIVFLLEELISPLFTPIMLIFRVRPKSQDIVDFFFNYTVDVAGVGDVCSFAQMDVRKHGNPKWTPPGITNADRQCQGEEGKTELSLMHFVLANPMWKPPEHSATYLGAVRQQATKDASELVAGHPAPGNSLAASLCVLGGSSQPSGGTVGSPLQSALISESMSSSGGRASAVVRGAVSHMSGPQETSGDSGVLGAALRDASGGALSHLGGAAVELQPASLAGGFDPMLSLDFYSSEMSASAVYLHELHRTDGFSRMGYDRLEHVRQVYRQPDMPSIAEYRRRIGADDRDDDLDNVGGMSSTPRPSVT